MCGKRRLTSRATIANTSNGIVRKQPLERDGEEGLARSYATEKTSQSVCAATSANSLSEQELLASALSPATNIWESRGADTHDATAQGSRGTALRKCRCRRILSREIGGGEINARMSRAARAHHNLRRRLRRRHAAEGIAFVKQCSVSQNSRHA